MTAQPNPPPVTVSVVIPTYNRAKLLVEAVESALQQTRPPDEIVVIDDGSKDDTAQVVAQFGDRLRYVRQENAGQAVARSHGFRIAAGEFIALLDSDDLWVKDRLERQLAALARHPDLDFLFGLETKFTADNQFDQCEIKEPDVLAILNSADVAVPDPFGLLLIENFVPTSTVLFRKRCFEAVGPMDTVVQPAEDYDFWIRIARHGFKFGFVNATLCHRRLHSGNLVNEWMKLNLAMATVLGRYVEQAPAQRARAERRLSNLHYDLGSHLFYRRDFSRALPHLRQVKPSARTLPFWAIKLAVARLLGGRAPAPQ